MAIHRSEEAILHFLSLRMAKRRALGRHLVAQPFQIVAHNQQVARPALTIRHPVRSSASTLKPSSRHSKGRWPDHFRVERPICLGPFSFARNCAIEIAGRVTMLTVPREPRSTDR